MIGIALNLAFVIIEAVTGFFTHSLALLSDAGHNLADVGTLALSLLAFRLTRVRSSEKYTYGYRKTSILVTLFNAVVLLTSVGAISVQAFMRFANPEPLQGDTIAYVAGAGILVNSVSAFLFKADKEKDMNVKGAYLHLLGDALVSVVVLIGGIVIYYTHWFRIDALLSLAVGAVILYSTLNLLKESFRLTLDGVPGNVKLHDIRDAALSIEGVKDIHHIHLWGISTTENAITAHLLLDDKTSQERESIIKHELKHKWEHLSVQHATIETERTETDCESEDC